jgi:hypothetical protein
MRHDERVVYFYDLRVISRTEHAVLPTVRELVDVLSAEQQAGRMRAPGDRAGNVWHFLGPVEIDEQLAVATLLIRKSDRRSPEYGYSDLESGALRVLVKAENEGGDAAAHVLISLHPSEPDTYIAVVEGVTGINHRNVLSLFNGLLTGFYRTNPRHFTYPDPAGAHDKAGQLKRHEFRPRFTMLGHISDQLTQDLENGTIGDIELRNNRVHTVIGNDPFIVSKSFRLTLGVQPDIPRNNVLDRLVGAIRSKHATYDTARIYFKDTSGHGKSVEIDVATGAIEQSYVQARRISNIFPPLRMTTDTIVPRLADRMRQLLADYRDNP